MQRMWGYVEFAYRSFALAQFLTATCKPNSDLPPSYRPTSRLFLHWTVERELAPRDWTLSRLRLLSGFLPKNRAMESPDSQDGVGEHAAFSPSGKDEFQC